MSDRSEARTIREVPQKTDFVQLLGQILANKGEPTPENSDKGTTKKTRSIK